MENLDHIPAHILDLLEKNIAFEKLHASEQNEVLKYMTEHEFESYQKSIREGKKILLMQAKTLVSNDSTRYVLEYAMNKRKEENQTKIISLVHHKISLYKVASAAAVLLIAFYVLIGSNIGSDDAHIVYVNNTDTIYKTVYQQVALKNDSNFTSGSAGIDTDKEKTYRPHKSSQIKEDEPSVYTGNYHALQIPIDDFVKRETRGKTYMDDTSLTLTRFISDNVRLL